MGPGSLSHHKNTTVPSRAEAAQRQIKTLISPGLTPLMRSDLLIYGEEGAGYYLWYWHTYFALFSVLGGGVGLGRCPYGRDGSHVNCRRFVFFDSSSFRSATDLWSHKDGQVLV